jgi:hypothetical protein
MKRRAINGHLDHKREAVKQLASEKFRPIENKELTARKRRMNPRSGEDESYTYSAVIKSNLFDTAVAKETFTGQLPINVNESISFAYYQQPQIPAVRAAAQIPPMDSTNGSLPRNFNGGCLNHIHADWNDPFHNDYLYW